jgi:hypothetical protein
MVCAPMSHTSLVSSEGTSGGSLHSPDRFVVFRWLLVVTEGLSIWITWPLWQVRVWPPMLPLVEHLPQVDFAVLLLASLAVAVVRPATGLALHSVLLLAAMSRDQMRLQPEFISQAILLWGTLPWKTTRAIARAHLIALWFFGGFHKLISPSFYTGDARWLVTSFFPSTPHSVSTLIGVSVAVLEMSLAGCALVPRTRPLAVRMAYLFHVGIVLTLGFGLRWDEAVWPWNLALAAAGYVFVGSWENTFREELRPLGIALRGAVALILTVPLGYDFGLVDTYLGHVLYSNDAPQAWIRTIDGRRQSIDTRPKLKVPVPQIDRLYIGYFAAAAGPGDQLEIADPRLWHRWRGTDRRVISYEQVVGSGR